jgi:hypothetical protein
VSWNLSWQGAANAVEAGLRPLVEQIARERTGVEASDAKEAAQAAEHLVTAGLEREWSAAVDGYKPHPFLADKLATVAAYGHRDSAGLGSVSVTVSLSRVPTPPEEAK